MHKLRLDSASLILLIGAVILVGLTPVPFSVFGGLALALVLPGASLLCAIGEQLPIKGFERLLMIAGASIVVTIFCGIALNSADVRLTRSSWSWSLAAVSAVLLFTAFAYQRLFRKSPVTLTWRQPSLTACVVGLSVLVMAGAALTVALLGFNKDQTTFTQLWALRRDSSPPSISLGIQNYETNVTQYRLVLTIANIRPKTTIVRLEPGQRWQKIISVPAPNTPLTATLFKTGQTRPYRYVRLAK
jgi:uncharacterized membrane protein